MKPGYAKKLVSDALELRAASCMDELGNDRAKKMTIAPEILQKMIDAPYFLGKFQVHSCSQATFGQISHPDQHVDKEASLEEAWVWSDSKAWRLQSAADQGHGVLGSTEQETDCWIGDY